MNTPMPDDERQRLEKKLERLSTERQERKLKPHEKKEFARIKEVLGMQKNLRDQMQESLSPETESDKEAELQKLIENVESGFRSITEKWVPEIPKVIPPGAAKTMVETPFHIFEINTKNPFRNLITLKNYSRKNPVRHLKAGTYNPLAMPVVVDPVQNKGFHFVPDNPHYFYYDNNWGRSARGRAGFVGMDRKMIIGSIEPANELDMIMIHHEIFHSSQDARKRANIKNLKMWQQYCQTETFAKGTREKIVVTREFEAIAASIELLNVILHDTLRQEPQTVRTEDVAQTLSATNEQLSELNAFLHLAGKYYPEGVSQGRYPQEFIDAVVSQNKRSFGAVADLCIERDGQLIKLN